MADVPGSLSAFEGQPSTHGPFAWANDWDLLSPRFQAEATSYLQVAGFFIVIFLITKRARLFKSAVPLFSRPFQRPFSRKSKAPPTTHDAGEPAALGTSVPGPSALDRSAPSDLSAPDLSAVNDAQAPSPAGMPTRTAAPVFNHLN